MTAPDEQGAFDVAAMSADLATVRKLIHAFFNQVKAEDWRRPTESRPQGWMLKEAFCHIVAVAEVVDAGIEGVLEENPAYTSPIRSRKKLAAHNREQIDQRKSLPPEHLLQSFLEALDRTEARIADLPEADLERPIPLNAYSRPVTVAEAVGIQLCHPVIVHGAQLPNGMGSEPLWRCFSAGMMERQLSRFFRILALAYWPERGGDISAVINFNIRAKGGGCWHLRLDQDGGKAVEGYGERPNLTLRFASPDAFCSVFTAQLSPLKGTFTGKVFAWGKIPLAFKLPRFFSPT